MDRDQVLSVVIKHMKQNIDGLDESQIDPSRSMLDQGASSLDVVEIVAASMRELRIKVPRTALANLKCIDDLVDLFVEVKAKSA